ncbi:PREDICTED: translation initiation factor IF-2-like [Capra hircus]|uniref:translation initiation factor IF-2-like n=1 Tax=Capra hircus TaxID=9925 RepID=UPI00084641F2|nr:PREDICTED: translation initiation factor IF-2-like [Capra hircus]
MLGAAPGPSAQPSPAPARSPPGTPNSPAPRLGDDHHPPLRPWTREPSHLGGKQRRNLGARPPSARLGFGPAAERREAPGRVAMAVESGRRLRERAPGGDEGRRAVCAVAEDAPVPAGGSGGGPGTRCLWGTGSKAERARCPGSAPCRGTPVFCPSVHPTPT